MEASNGKSVEIFFSYARKDERLMSELEKHLRIMQRDGLIIGWHDNKVEAGEELEREVNVHLNKAEIILLLISPDFMASEYCYSIQMKRAMERHEKGETLVIPVILRAVDWEGAPFSKLQALPKSAKPVTHWRSRDEAFMIISKGIKSAIKTFSTPPIKSDKLSSLVKVKETLYCYNCKSLVSLPMPCWKCGLPPMQICKKCFAKNPINRETCQKCNALLALICSYCKTKNSYEAALCRICGLQLQIVCNDCEERNSLDRETCQKCGVSLIQVCSHCSKKNSHNADLCLRCGMPLFQVCISCEAFNQIEDDICWSCSDLLDQECSLEGLLYLTKVSPG